MVKASCSRKLIGESSSGIKVRHHDEISWKCCNFHDFRIWNQILVWFPSILASKITRKYIVQLANGLVTASDHENYDFPWSYGVKMRNFMKYVNSDISVRNCASGHQFIEISLYLLRCAWCFSYRLRRRQPGGLGAPAPLLKHCSQREKNIVIYIYIYIHTHAYI